MVIKTNPFTENIIENFTQKRLHNNIHVAPDHSYSFNVFFKLHCVDKYMHLNSECFHLQ